MGTPARKTILDDIGTTLATITTGNGYKTTVLTVEAVGKGWGDVGAGAKPWLGYVPNQERLEYFPGGSIKAILNLSILCHVDGSTQSARSTSLNNLLDDIIKALAVDTSRSGNAISTTLTTVSTDEGSPDANGFGSMVIAVDIPYLRTTSGS
tara:strand:+ start:10485 stop:10940 length:456 start_codon:yes stop_codon:yes gene_type:complete